VKASLSWALTPAKEEKSNTHIKTLFTTSKRCFAKMFKHETEEGKNLLIDNLEF